MRSSISDHARQRAVVLLVDANGTMAVTIEGCVGDVVSGKLSQTSAAFGNFLCDSALWLPATFAAFGDAVLGTSFSKCGQSMSRVDYVASSRDIVAKEQTAVTWCDFVLPNFGYDHVPTCVRLYVSFRHVDVSVRRRVSAYDRASVRDPVNVAEFSAILKPVHQPLSSRA